MALAIEQPLRSWTYQDYLKIEDDLLYEIMEGELEMAPSPGTYHQRSSRDLGFAVWKYVKDTDQGEVLFAPTDVILDEKNKPQPDLMFVSKERLTIIRDAGIFGCPDMVVEIISPTSIHRDRYRKKAMYEKFGVPEYWIVDALYKTVEVLTLQEGGYILHSFARESGIVESKVIKGFQIEIADIFLPR